MSKKHWLIVLALVAMLALALAACGGAQEGGEAAATEAPKEEMATEAPKEEMATEEAKEEGGQEMAEATCEDEWGCVEIAPDEPIQIGVMQVLSGGAANYGEAGLGGVRVAQAERPEVLGHKVELVVEDSQCNAEGGQIAAQKLTSNDKIVGIIGANCSSACTPAAQIVTDANMFMISNSCTAPALTAPDTHKLGFLRTVYNDAYQGAVVAEFVYNVLGLKKMATIHDGTPYPQQLQEVACQRFEELGGECVAQEAINPDDTDMRPVLTRIAEKQPEVLFFPLYPEAGGHVARQAKEVEGFENVVLIGADGLKVDKFLEAAGDAAKGMWFTGPEVPQNEEYAKKYVEINGSKPPAPFGEQAYDAYNIILNAIEQVAIKKADGGLLIPRKALLDALYATKDYQGLTGTLSANEYGDFTSPETTKIVIYMAEEVDGELDFVPKYTYFNGEFTEVK